MKEDYRHVPHEIPTEQALLGSLLINNRSLERVADSLRPEHFYDNLHARIYDFIVHGFMAGSTAVTPLTLHAALKADAGLVEVGGLRYLANLAEAAPAIPNVKEYARVLVEHWTRRQLIQAGEDIVNLAYEPTFETTVDQQVAQAERVVESLGARWRSNSGFRQPEQISDIGLRIIKRAEGIARGDKPRLIPTGLRKLDAKIGGIGGSELVILPGESGMGKSATLGAIARNSARAGYPTFVFSLEMTNDGYGVRMICDEDFALYRSNGYSTPLYYEKFRQGTLSDTDFERAVLANQRLQDLPLEICDDDTLDMTGIAARARAFASKFPKGTLGLVCLDYIQIVATDQTKNQNRERDVADVVRACKKLAKSLDWGVLAAAQVNENAATRGKDRRPRLSDVRESKAIVQEADIAIFPFRKAYHIYNEKPEIGSAEGEFAKWQAEYQTWKNRIEFIIPKVRQGRVGEVMLWCDMGASAIRDEEPGMPEVEQAQNDLALPL